MLVRNKGVMQNLRCSEWGFLSPMPGKSLLKGISHLLAKTRFLPIPLRAFGLKLFVPRFTLSMSKHALTVIMPTFNRPKSRTPHAAFLQNYAKSAGFTFIMVDNTPDATAAAMFASLQAECRGRNAGLPERTLRRCRKCTQHRDASCTLQPCRISR